MRKFMKSLMTVTAVLGSAGLAHAQHSYLPAQQLDPHTHKIAAYTGAPLTADRVMIRGFTTTTGDGLVANGVRAGGTSGFMQDAMIDDDANPITPLVPNPSFAVHKGPLAANADLIQQFMVLSNTQNGAAGKILYWDGTGVTPNFGNAPTNTTIRVGKLSGTLAPKTVIDGGTAPLASFVYDTSNAQGGRSSHFHYQYDVVGDNASAGNVAPDGVYLIGFQLSMPGAVNGEGEAFETSDTIWQLLLKKSLVDGVTPFGASGLFDTALLPTQTWLAGSISATGSSIPEPTVGLMVLAGSGLLFLKRRKSA